MGPSHTHAPPVATDHASTHRGTYLEPSNTHRSPRSSACLKSWFAGLFMNNEREGK
jgi:hypothetical protein